MVKMRDAAITGVPESVTVIVTVFVVGISAPVGVQVKTPVDGLICDVPGPWRENVSDCVGKSESLAMALTVRVSPSMTNASGIAANVGATLTSRTVIENCLLAER